MRLHLKESSGFTCENAPRTMPLPASLDPPPPEDTRASAPFDRLLGCFHEQSPRPRAPRGAYAYATLAAPPPPRRSPWTDPGTGPMRASTLRSRWVFRPDPPPDGVRGGSGRNTTSTHEREVSTHTRPGRPQA